MNNTHNIFFLFIVNRNSRVPVLVNLFHNRLIKHCINIKHENTLQLAVAVAHSLVTSRNNSLNAHRLLGRQVVGRVRWWRLLFRRILSKATTVVFQFETWAPRILFLLDVIVSVHWYQLDQLLALEQLRMLGTQNPIDQACKRVHDYEGGIDKNPQHRNQKATNLQSVLVADRLW